MKIIVNEIPYIINNINESTFFVDHCETIQDNEHDKQIIKDNECDKQIIKDNECDKQIIKDNECDKQIIKDNECDKQIIMNLDFDNITMKNIVLYLNEHKIPSENLIETLIAADYFIIQN